MSYLEDVVVDAEGFSFQDKGKLTKELYLEGLEDWRIMEHFPI